MRRLIPLLALLLAGCGAPSADLFAVERDGKGTGAKLKVVVADGGTVKCNGVPFALNADLLLQARQLARDLVEPVGLGLDLPPDANTTFTYKVIIKDGEASWADDAREAPRAFTKVAGFTRVVATSICRLPR